MVTRSAPGFLLGLFVVAGTVVAALAVRPRAGRMIFPVPVLSYLVGALVSGFIYNRAAGTSKTALAIGAAQWIADGFFAMALATALAIAIITARWYLWRRRRPVTPRPGLGGARRHPARPAATAAGGTGIRYRVRTQAPGPPGLRGARGRRRVPTPGIRGLERRRPARRRPAPGTAARNRALQLLQRGVAEHQVLDAVVGTEVDLRLGLVAVTVRRDHGAETELVVGHHVPRRQRGHRAVPR